MSSINAYVSSGAVSKENETCQSKILLKPLSIRNTQDGVGGGWGGIKDQEFLKTWIDLSHITCLLGSLQKQKIIVGKPLPRTSLYMHNNKNYTEYSNLIESFFVIVLKSFFQSAKCKMQRRLPLNCNLHFVGTLSSPTRI